MSKLVIESDEMVRACVPCQIVEPSKSMLDVGVAAELLEMVL